MAVQECHAKDIDHIASEVETHLERGLSEEEAIQRAREFVFVGVDYVKDVTHGRPFVWDEKGELSGNFRLVSGNAPAGEADASALRTLREPLPPADIPIVAYDFGMKYNILRRLRQHGFRVQVVPAGTPAEEALRYKPAGIFLSNGPGDPAALLLIFLVVSLAWHSPHMLIDQSINYCAASACRQPLVTRLPRDLHSAVRRRLAD